MIPILLERCPGFAPAWQKHREEWGQKQAGIYNDLAKFVHFLVKSYGQGETDSFPAVFEAVEVFIVEGDEETKNAAALGILETLQCVASWKPFGARAFVKWLGPKSREAWAEIEEMWRGKNSLMDVIRAERLAQQSKLNRWYQFWKRR